MSKSRKIRHQAVVAVYLVLRHEGKVLMGLRQNTGYMDGNWMFPSGHTHESEGSRRALCREAEEEIGVVLQPRDLDLLLTMHRPEVSRFDLFFEATVEPSVVENREPHKCQALEWHLTDSLPVNTVDYIVLALDCIERGIKYSEFWNHIPGI
jgi:8-oxo-dGTP diphosphatase